MSEAVELFTTSIRSHPVVRGRHERYISVLSVLHIPFICHDLASDPEAKRRWRRKAIVDPQIPGLLVHNEWRGTFAEFEEAVENGEVHAFLRIEGGHAPRAAPAAPSARAEDRPRPGKLPLARLAPPGSGPRAEPDADEMLFNLLPQGTTVTDAQVDELLKELEKPLQRTPRRTYVPSNRSAHALPLANMGEHKGPAPSARFNEERNLVAEAARAIGVEPRPRNALPRMRVNRKPLHEILSERRRRQEETENSRKNDELFESLGITNVKLSDQQVEEFLNEGKIPILEHEPASSTKSEQPPDTGDTDSREAHMAPVPTEKETEDAGGPPQETPETLNKGEDGLQEAPKKAEEPPEEGEDIDITEKAEAGNAEGAPAKEGGVLEDHGDIVNAENAEVPTEESEAAIQEEAPEKEGKISEEHRDIEDSEKAEAPTEEAEAEETTDEAATKAAEVPEKYRGMDNTKNAEAPTKEAEATETLGETCEEAASEEIAEKPEDAPEEVRTDAKEASEADKDAAVEPAEAPRVEEQGKQEPVEMPEDEPEGLAGLSKYGKAEEAAKRTTEGELEHDAKESDEYMQQPVDQQHGDEPPSDDKEAPTPADEEGPQQGAGETNAGQTLQQGEEAPNHSAEKELSHNAESAKADTEAPQQAAEILREDAPQREAPAVEKTDKDTDAAPEEGVNVPQKAADSPEATEETLAEVSPAGKEAPQQTTAGDNQLDPAWGEEKQEHAVEVAEGDQAASEQGANVCMLASEEAPIVNEGPEQPVEQAPIDQKAPNQAAEEAQEEQKVPEPTAQKAPNQAGEKVQEEQEVPEPITQNALQTDKEGHTGAPHKQVMEESQGEERAKQDVDAQQPTAEETGFDGEIPEKAVDEVRDESEALERSAGGARTTKSAEVTEEPHIMESKQENEVPQQSIEETRAGGDAQEQTAENTHISEPHEQTEEPQNEISEQDNEVPTHAVKEIQADEVPKRSAVERLQEEYVKETPDKASAHAVEEDQGDDKTAAQIMFQEEKVAPAQEAEENHGGSSTVEQVPGVNAESTQPATDMHKSEQVDHEGAEEAPATAAANPKVAEDDKLLGETSATVLDHADDDAAINHIEPRVDGTIASKPVSDHGADALANTSKEVEPTHMPASDHGSAVEPVAKTTGNSTDSAHITQTDTPSQVAGESKAEAEQEESTGDGAVHPRITGETEKTPERKNPTIQEATGAVAQEGRQEDTDTPASKATGTPPAQGPIADGGTSSDINAEGAHGVANARKNEGSKASALDPVGSVDPPKPEHKEHAETVDGNQCGDAADDTTDSASRARGTGRLVGMQDGSSVHVEQQHNQARAGGLGSGPAPHKVEDDVSTDDRGICSNAANAVCPLRRGQSARNTPDPENSRLDTNTLTTDMRPDPPLTLDLEAEDAPENDYDVPNTGDSMWSKASALVHGDLSEGPPAVTEEVCVPVPDDSEPLPFLEFRPKPDRCSVIASEKTFKNIRAVPLVTMPTPEPSPTSAEAPVQLGLPNQPDPQTEPDPQTKQDPQSEHGPQTEQDPKSEQDTQTEPDMPIDPTLPSHPDPPIYTGPPYAEVMPRRVQVTSVDLRDIMMPGPSRIHNNPGSTMSNEAVLQELIGEHEPRELLVPPGPEEPEEPVFASKSEQKRREVHSPPTKTPPSPENRPCPTSSKRLSDIMREADEILNEWA